MEVPRFSFSTNKSLLQNVGDPLQLKVKVEKLDENYIIQVKLMIVAVKQAYFHKLL